MDAESEDEYIHIIYIIYTQRAHIKITSVILCDLIPLNKKTIVLTSNQAFNRGEGVMKSITHLM
jgi:hypothetical protein